MTNDSKAQPIPIPEAQSLTTYLTDSEVAVLEQYLEAATVTDELRGIIEEEGYFHNNLFRGISTTIYSGVFPQQSIQGYSP